MTENQLDMCVTNAKPYSCRTKTKVTKYKHTWTVQDLHYFDESSLWSVKYSTDDSKTIEWRWNLIIKENNNAKIRLNLYFYSCGEKKHYNANIKITKNHMQSITYEKKGTAVKEKHYECVNVKRDEDENVLKFDFELAIIDELKCDEDNIPFVKHPELPAFCINLIDDKDFCDVVIAVGAEQFTGHKAVLANRSSVFRAMLKNEMVESKQNKVVITDIEPKVFGELLRFIYTDSVDDLDTFAFELLQAADKYDLQKLKSMCEASLCGRLSEETAVDTLDLADLYRADRLKRATIDFIKMNVGLIQTEEWRKLTMKNFELANGVVIDIMKSMQIK